MLVACMSKVPSQSKIGLSGLGCRTMGFVLCAPNAVCGRPAWALCCPLCWSVRAIFRSNGHSTDFLGEQVASLATFLIQAKESPAAVGIPVAPVPGSCPGLCHQINICKNTPEIGLFWAVFSHKKPLCCVMCRCVPLCCGHGHYVALG